MMEQYECWDSNGDGWPEDRFLREYGWRVQARPAKGEPIWTNAKLTLPQSQAVAHICQYLRRQGLLK